MEQHIASAAHASRPWIKPMARVGYTARGMVYMVIGWLALLSGLGGGGGTTDSKGAVQTLMASGPGLVIAIILILGLLSYALWRFIQAALDPDDHGLSAKGTAIRIGLAASGITYLGLTAYTFSLWRGSASGGEGGAGAFSDWVTGIIGGTAAAFALAAILAGVAIAHFIKAWKRGYEKYMELDEDTKTKIAPVAVTGLVARGSIFVVLAVLLFYHGSLAGEGKPGTEDALNFIHELPFGSVLLIAVAVGLIAFALYSFAEAAWRRVDPVDA
ncbi:DUF1206 domain-containing protein [Tianweitania sp. BSSL-BM11]|uniref:DUF1206 domain-containing protein n=1 Tax=Tianweitania aestuarii TaxID=2814886 RepID=A0ABS5RX67_9HYPH|nr:DUF1206 domain-containing protein [Tianweitania aestuarii]MBS9720809.1 DUF1206 domain-containing protein [Tianweitania aestuarii]